MATQSTGEAVQEEDEEAEFQVVPFEQARTEFLKRKHKLDDAFHASRYDPEERKALSKRRREENNDEYAGGPDGYDPAQDPELYRHNCYFCVNKSHPEYPRFYGILSEHLGRAKLETIIDMMYNCYDLFINPYVSPDIEITRAIIKEHIFHHLNEPLVEYYVQMEQYKTTRNILYDLCFQSNKNGEHLIDYKAIATIEKINAKILALYKEKPNAALFVDAELNLAGGGMG